MHTDCILCDLMLEEYEREAEENLSEDEAEREKNIYVKKGKSQMKNVSTSLSFRIEKLTEDSLRRVLECYTSYKN